MTTGDKIASLLNYIEYCAEVVADRGVTDAIYLDFAKAFDTIPHRRLLGKLQAYGIDSQVYNWIQAFLLGRVQRVCVNGSLSEEEPVISGIPQGSVVCSFCALGWPAHRVMCNVQKS